MKLISSLILAVILLMSCDCYIAIPIPPTPVTWDSAYVFVIANGESNAAGFADDSSATVLELSARSQVQILNNTNFNLQDLHIDVNNDLDNANMYANKHGIELELANQSVADSYFHSLIYLAKTGQNGSTFNNWLPAAPGGYLNKFEQRVDSVKYKLNRTGIEYKMVIFLSIGINDYHAGTSPASYYTKMVTHITNLRARTHTTTPIVMTKFFAPYNIYNNALDSVVNFSGLDSVYTIADTTASRLDAYHWDYSGMKIKTNQFITKVKQIYP